MPVSAFDLFRIGIGPSSSHTVGPMRIAGRFVGELQALGSLEQVAHIEVHLHGSLALTGRGHGTDRAVLLGLMGEVPERVDVDQAEALVRAARTQLRVALGGRHGVAFDEGRQLLFHPASLPQHPNGMRLLAADGAGRPLLERTMFSVGGGFVTDQREFGSANAVSTVNWPCAYRSGAELLDMCRESGVSIAQLALRNESALRPEADVVAGLDAIRAAMFGCMERGLRCEGHLLPGELKVPRRAGALHRMLVERRESGRPRKLAEFSNGTVTEQHSPLPSWLPKLG